MSTYQPSDGGPSLTSVIIVDQDNQPVSVGGGGGSSAPPTGLSMLCGITRTTFTDATTGMTPAGLFEVSIANVGTVDALVDYDVLKAGETVTFRSPEYFIVLSRITYGGIGATLMVSTMSVVGV